MDKSSQLVIQQSQTPAAALLSRAMCTVQCKKVYLSHNNMTNRPYTIPYYSNSIVTQKATLDSHHLASRFRNM